MADPGKVDMAFSQADFQQTLSTGTNAVKELNQSVTSERASHTAHRSSFTDPAATLDGDKGLAAHRELATQVEHLNTASQVAQEAAQAAPR